MILKSRIKRGSPLPDDLLEYDPINDVWQPDDTDARLAAYQKLGVTHLRWISQPGACDICIMNDGHVVPLGQAFPNGNILPQCHPHCECQVIPVSPHHTIHRGNMTLLYRYITAAEREKIPREDYAWPDAPDGPEYPCDTQAHVNSCATLLGKAPKDKQAAIKARAKRIAKRHGFSIPKSWQEDTDDRTLLADYIRSPMTTRVKKIPNSAPGAPSTPAQTPDPENIERAQIFIPIMRVDAERRMIEGQATIEDLDGYGTVFSYEASKKAFERWEGNIREMHKGEAVGRALEVEFDDEHKAIYVRCFISKGAESTWQKILDGTLRGFSVGAKAAKEAWSTIERAGKAIPYLTDYTLVELSVVDNPATPGCNFAIIRAEGYTNVLAPDSELQRDLDGLSDASMDGSGELMHAQYNLHAARDAIMIACGCAACSAFLAGTYDNDDLRSVQPDFTSHFTPALQRLDAISAGLATRNTDMATRFAAMERQLAAITQLVQQSITKSDETRTELATVHAVVDRVATQPLPASSGPVRNTNGANVNQLDERALLKMAAEKGLLSNDDQMAAAAKLLLGHRK